MDIAPAPWKLTGEAFVSVYKFSKKIVKDHCFMADYQADNWRGGLGTVMLVNYKSSNVGPYFELLFIPGIINLKKINLQKIKSGFSISKIYVSSQASVDNGISNWGIPKELADFQWTISDSGAIEIKVFKDNQLFFDAKIHKNKFRIPVTTSFLPLKIIQKLGDQFFLTKPKASGKMAFAKLKNIQIDPAFFPKIALIKPLISVNISNFKMIFPKAIIE